MIISVMQSIKMCASFWGTGVDIGYCERGAKHKGGSLKQGVRGLSPEAMARNFGYFKYIQVDYMAYIHNLLCSSPLQCHTLSITIHSPYYWCDGIGGQYTVM